MTAINWNYGSHLRTESPLFLRRGDSGHCWNSESESDLYYRFGAPESDEKADFEEEEEEEEEEVEEELDGGEQKEQEEEYEETLSLIPKRRNSHDESFEDENNSVLATIVEPTFFLFAAMLVGMFSALAAAVRLRF